MTHDKKPKIYDLFVLPPQNKPVYFIVEGVDYKGDGGADFDSRQFLFEEHSCPTNWFRPVHIVHDGDNDPHGLLRYLGSKAEAEIPEDEVVSPNDHDRAFDAWIAACNHKA